VVFFPESDSTKLSEGPKRCLKQNSGALLPKRECENYRPSSNSQLGAVEALEAVGVNITHEYYQRHRYCP